MTFSKLPEAVRVTIMLVIFLAVIAGVIAASFLGNPWYAITQIVVYALIVSVVAVRLRECFRLARTPQQKSGLKLILLWLLLAVLGVVGHVGDVVQSDNQDYIRAALPLWIYFALLAALDLSKSLLAAGGEDQRAATAENPLTAAEPNR
jgi:hypothetical protein